MGSLHKNIQLMLELFKAPLKVQGPTLFLLYINDLLDYTIYTITIYADNTALYFKCDQTSDLWQNLEFVSGPESDIQDTVDWGRKWLIDFNDRKTQLALLDRSNVTGVIDVKMDGSVLEKESSFKVLGIVSFSCKLDCDSYIISIVKIISDKIGVLIRSMKFFSA